MRASSLIDWTDRETKAILVFSAGMDGGHEERASNNNVCGWDLVYVELYPCDLGDAFGGNLNEFGLMDALADSAARVQRGMDGAMETHVEGQVWLVVKGP